jgi:beta-glucosidase
VRGKGLTEFLRADEEAEEARARTCVEFPGVRLADGEGGTIETIEDATPELCLRRCRETSECEQSIFSAGNSGCYLFGQSTDELEGVDVDLFNSAYCGLERDLKHREQLVSESMKQMRLAQVKANWARADERAREVLSGLTQEDKLLLVHGSPGGLGYAGFLKVSGIDGVMSLKMNDGPQGYNTYQDTLAGTSTQFPCLLAVAASFNPDTAERYAGAIADEFAVKSSNVLLGPDIEVTRAPLTGRGFETISGEDPYLGSQLVGPYVRAIQRRGIIATVKHWLDNNQEIYRMTMDAEVDDRAQHEIYMPAFKAAFDAGAAAVMCSYNKVNGVHACGSQELLTQLLREELGFKGFVVSDWGATHDAQESLNAGLDVEMPLPKQYQHIPALLANGTIRQDVIDGMATHVLSSMHFVGQFDGRFTGKAGAWGHLPATTDEHRSVALHAIIDSAVLLKNNEDTLPLKPEWRNIALVGKYCDQAFEKDYAQGSVYSGGGSGFVNTTRTLTPFKALQQRLRGAQVTLSTDASGAKGADVAVICAAAHSEEGWDRKSMEVPEAAQLVQALRNQTGGAQQRIVVLAIVPGVVTTDWATEADAVLMLFMPGEQIGNAVAQLLTGDAGPAGRLPVTMPTAGEDRLTSKQYPGECPPPNTWCENMTAKFSEGVLVGYRWNDAVGTRAAFPFGFGLAYTRFDFRNFRARCLEGGKVEVSFTVANTGPRAGAVVPQVYVGFPSLRPALRQLRRFQKLQITNNTSSEVVFILGEGDWSFYDANRKNWSSAAARREEVTVSVGTSSVDLLWNHTLTFTGGDLCISTQPSQPEPHRRPGFRVLPPPRPLRALPTLPPPRLLKLR